VNTCVVERIKENQSKMQLILNYLLMKFQNLVKDEYIIHKRTLKIEKKKRYKDHKGTGSETVPEFILPKELDIDVFKNVKK
jgi:hypothetical protein